MNTKEQNRRRRPAAGKKAAPSQNARVQTPKKAGTTRQPVVYTEPKPFSARRFLLRMATVLAVVFALVFGMVIFFKVKERTVSGCEKYTAAEIMEASGIREGDSLLGIRDAQISGRIITKLPYVDSVRVGIKLPDTVMIEVTELEVVYAVQDRENHWWLMSAAGKIVDSVSAPDAKGYTQILGLALEVPQIGGQAAAWEEPPETESETQSLPGETGTSAPTVITGGDRLDTCLTILKALEDNGMIGDISGINLKDMGALEMWYGQRYQILLGDTQRLPYKIAFAGKAIGQMGEHQSGILDVSFSIRQDEAMLTPFEK